MKLLKKTFSYIILFLIAGGISFQCAFLNTFYNAQAAFNLANREHTERMEEHPDSVIIPTGTILSNYNRAYDKAAKVLQVYPKKKKWHDDAVFLMARTSYYQGDYTKTIRSLKQFQKEYPLSPHIPQSWLYLGKAYMRDENLEKAEETFNYTKEKYPELNQNDEISLLLAKVAIAREGKVYAVELLEKAIKSVKSADKKVELVIKIAELYLELKQYDKALEVLRSSPRRTKSTYPLFRLDFLLVETYIAKDSLNKALTLSNRMSANKKYNQYEPQILIQKAKLLNKQNKTDLAIEMFEKVYQRHESTEQAAIAWYELGEIYLHKKADYEKAREYFKKAASRSTLPEIAAQAQSRLNALEVLEQYRNEEDGIAATEDVAMEQDTVDTLSDSIPLAYKIGELFWLDLDEPDSAYARFAKLSDDTSKPDFRAKALYSTAYIALHGLQDTTRADSLYELLIQLFPQNEYSKRAQLDRDMPITVKTVEDQAYEAFLLAEALYTEQNNPLGAVNAYYKVYQQYKDQEIAPRSLYAAAWLCDNILNKNETALRLYKTLCTKYPDSEQCLEGGKQRVKTALDTLAVLKKNQSQQKITIESK